MNLDKNIKGALGTLIIMILLMITEALWYPIGLDGSVPVYWITYSIILVIAGRWKEHKDEKIVFILPLAIIINYILYRVGIYIPNSFIIIGFMAAISILYIVRANINYKKISILGVLIIFVGYFLLNHLVDENHLIKDRFLYKSIKKEYSIKGKITKEDLRKVTLLYGVNFSDVSTLEGIEYMENLERITIRDNIRIGDYSNLNRLKHLKMISIHGGDLNKLSTFSNMESVESLHISDPKRGEFKNLSNFPNMKIFTSEEGDIKFENLQGAKELEEIVLYSPKSVNFKGVENLNKLKSLRIYDGNLDLRGLEGGKTLETLEIMSPKSVKINGVEGLDNLKTLKFKQVYIESVDEILKCKSLKIVELDNCTLKDKEGFIKKLEDRGLSIYKRGNVAQGDYNMMK